MINELLDLPGIKCFVLTNRECRPCQEWMGEHYELFKSQYPDVTWYVLDCLQEQENGRMPFPPLISPTFYLYNSKEDFPIITAGILPEPEMTLKFNRFIEAVKNG